MNTHSVPKYKVLNEGEVCITSLMGSDLDVVNAARVSFASHQTEMDDRAKGLINFLIKNKHATPFEHVVYTFYVKCPIFVAREWFRHRWSSFNEMSMRYHIPPTLHFYLPSSQDIRKQVGKPGSYTFEDISDPSIYTEVTERMKEVYEFAHFTYKSLIEKGVAKEIARSVLPVGQYTEFVWTVNLRSLMNFLSLRNDEHAQKEIREYAKVIEIMFEETMPETYKAFCENGREAV
jgi:thymidylate synthase (FAD)